MDGGVSADPPIDTTTTTAGDLDLHGVDDIMDVSVDGGIDAIVAALDAAAAAEGDGATAGDDGAMGATDAALARDDECGAAALGTSVGGDGCAELAAAAAAKEEDAAAAKLAAAATAKDEAKRKKETKRPKEEKEKADAVQEAARAAQEAVPKKKKKAQEAMPKKKVAKRAADASSSSEEEEQEPVREKKKAKPTEVTHANVERALEAGDYMFFRRNARTSRGKVYDLYLTMRVKYNTVGSLTIKVPSSGIPYKVARDHSILRYAIYLAFAAVTEEDFVARLCVVEALVGVCVVTPQLSEPAEALPIQFVMWIAVLAANAAGTGGKGREMDKLRNGTWRRRAVITGLLLEHADSWLAAPGAIVMAANTFITYDRRECLRELLMTGTARKDSLGHVHVLDIVAAALRNGTPWTHKLVITKLLADRIVGTDFINTRSEHLLQTLLHIDAQSPQSKGSYIAYFLRLGHSADAQDSMDHNALDLLQADAPPFAREVLARALAV